MTLAAGFRLGSYEILESLGAGGMGEVYRARDARLSHPAWSPTDPDTILFVRDHKRLATVSVSTGKVTLLPWTPQGSYVLDYPSWSPDGKKVYFSLARKTGDIYLLEGP